MDDLQRKWSKSTLVWLRAFLQQKIRNFDNGQCTVILIVFSSKYNFWSIGWSERLATQLPVKRFVIRALDMFCHPCNICMMKMNELCWNQICKNKSHTISSSISQSDFNWDKKSDNTRSLKLKFIWGLHNKWRVNKVDQKLILTQIVLPVGWGFSEWGFSQRLPFAWSWDKLLTIARQQRRIFETFFFYLLKCSCGKQINLEVNFPSS